jgi:hypothetical protein
VPSTWPSWFRVGAPCLCSANASRGRFIGYGFALLPNDMLRPQPTPRSVHIYRRLSAQEPAFTRCYCTVNAVHSPWVAANIMDLYQPHVHGDRFSNLPPKHHVSEYSEPSEYYCLLFPGRSHRTYRHQICSIHFYDKDGVGGAVDGKLACI